jgi:hypothetical protein
MKHWGGELMNIDSEEKVNSFATIYGFGMIATFIYLTFFDGYIYNAWNWLIAIPLNAFLSAIFPIYWGLLHWIQ